MLKKALLHPPFPKRAETRASPSFVLHRSRPQRTARVRLGLSLAAVALDGLFEHLHSFTDVIAPTAIGLIVCLNVGKSA